MLSPKYIIPSNFFWAKGMRFLSCKVSGFPKMIRLFPEISGNFRGHFEEFRSSEVSRHIWDWLKIKNNPQMKAFSFKIGEPGIWVVWSFLVHICESGMRNKRLACRPDLAWDQSFRLTGVRLMPKVWELVGIIHVIPNVLFMFQSDRSSTWQDKYLIGWCCMNS